MYFLQFVEKVYELEVVTRKVWSDEAMLAAAQGPIFPRTSFNGVEVLDRLARR